MGLGFWGFSAVEGFAIRSVVILKAIHSNVISTTQLLQSGGQYTSYASRTWAPNSKLVNQVSFCSLPCAVRCWHSNCPASLTYPATSFCTELYDLLRASLPPSHYHDKQGFQSIVLRLTRAVAVGLALRTSGVEGFHTVKNAQKRYICRRIELVRKSYEHSRRCRLQD